MTQKKTMTKNEAREWMSLLYVPVNSAEDYQKASIFMDQIAKNGALDEPRFPCYLHLWVNGYFHFTPNKEDFYKDELSLSDLLAIEIVEEPDHRSLLEEAVKDIAKMVHANQNLVNIAQLIAGWKATTPPNEWSDFDQDCVEWLNYIQEVNEELKAKYTYEVDNKKR